MPRSESTGLLLALAGFALLPFSDALIKTMAGQWPPPAIAMVRFLIAGVALSGIVVARQGLAGALQGFTPGIHIFRGFAMAVGTAAGFAALFMMPLGEMTAVAFTSPVFVALLATPLLGEPARRETWIATAGAFVGVILVLRPNVAAMGWAALLPLFAAFSFSLIIITNRVLAGRGTALAMQAYIAVFTALFLIVINVLGHLSGVDTLALTWPDWTIIARCAVMALIASTAHWLIFQGTVRAGAATVAPMSYAQLVIASLLGWALFDEAPDALALLGTAIIIAAGIYLWMKGRMREPVESE